MLDGRPGVTVTTARRKGAEWFVGSITNNDARALALRLDFLEPGKRLRESTLGFDVLTTGPCWPTRAPGWRNRPPGSP